jgi:hypothetical protein
MEFFRDAVVAGAAGAILVLLGHAQIKMRGFFLNVEHGIIFW